MKVFVEQAINILFILSLLLSIYKMIKYRNKIGKFFPLILIPITGLLQSFFNQIVNNIILSINNKQVIEEDYFFYAYIIIESFVFLWFFYENLNNKNIKIIIKFTCLGLAFCYLYLLSNNHKILKISYSYFLIAEGLAMICLSIITLIDVVFDDEILILHYSPKFIIASGILVFFSITFPINTISTYLIEHDFSSFVFINNFVLIGYILFYFMLIKAIDKAVSQ